MNLLPQYKELPAGTISLLCQAPSEDEHLLLQVYNISISKNHKLTALVSDGTLCAKAFFQNKDFLTPGNSFLTQKNTKTALSKSNPIWSLTQEKALVSLKLNSFANIQSCWGIPDQHKKLLTLCLRKSRLHSNLVALRLVSFQCKKKGGL